MKIPFDASKLRAENLIIGSDDLCMFSWHFRFPMILHKKELFEDANEAGILDMLDETINTYHA